MSDAHNSQGAQRDLNYGTLNGPPVFNYHAPPWPFRRTAWDQAMQQTFGLSRQNPPPINMIPAQFKTMDIFVDHLKSDGGWA